MTKSQKVKKERGIGKPLYIRSEDFDTWNEIEKEAEDLKIGIGTFICQKWKDMKNANKG